MLLLWTYSSETRMHAMKNLVYSSENLLNLAMW